jgi:hypothetical protein
VFALAASLCFGQLAMAQAGEEDLKFVRGFPTKETAQKLYDELDYQRAVQVYLRHIPAMYEKLRHFKGASDMNA